MPGLRATAADGIDLEIQCMYEIRNGLQFNSENFPNCSQLFPMVPNFRIPDLEMFSIVPKPRVVPMFPTRKNCSHVPKVFPSAAMFPCSLFPIGFQSMLVPIGKRHVPIGKQNHCAHLFRAARTSRVCQVFPSGETASHPSHPVSCQSVFENRPPLLKHIKASLGK